MDFSFLVALDSMFHASAERAFFFFALLFLDQKSSELSEGSLLDLLVDAFLIISEIFWR